jgi:DNA replication protein DnaC
VSDDWNISFYCPPLWAEPKDKLTEGAFVNAMVGREYWFVSGSKIPSQCRYRSEIAKMVASLPEDAAAGKGAIFYGGYGHGKSSASVIMLKAAYVRGAQMFFRKANLMKDAFLKQWAFLSPEGVPIWSMMTRCQFAVLDDLGAELVLAGYEKGDIRIMESIVRDRYDAKLPTYITTNLEMKDLMTAYPSLSSIFLDSSRYYLVEVTGKNWRNPDVRD